MYKARGAVVSNTINGCPPKTANRIPPTHWENKIFWTPTITQGSLDMCTENKIFWTPTITQGSLDMCTENKIFWTPTITQGSLDMCTDI